MGWAFRQLLFKAEKDHKLPVGAMKRGPTPESHLETLAKEIGMRPRQSRSPGA